MAQLPHRDPQSILIEKDIVSMMTAAMHGDDMTVMGIMMEHEPVELVQPLLGVALAFLRAAGLRHPEGVEGVLQEWGGRILQYEVAKGLEQQ